MTSTRILLLESIHSIAQTMLERENCSVELSSQSFEGDELCKRAATFDFLGIRSKTELTAEFFKKTPTLSAVGAFCIGTNQIDLEIATRCGIPVFNAPYSNTRSVAELVLAEIVALSRQIAERSAKAHLGIWQKSTEGSREVRGKVLGIIGYGHIGSQLSILAEGFGMRVIYYDIIKKLPLGNSFACDSLDDLLREADFVSLHVPETDRTKNMFSEPQLKMMKTGSYLINASRGTVVDINALANALKAKHLAGAAIDVFPEEPASNKEKFVSALQGLNNVILTPHIGGSTEEAQENIGREVAQSFLDFKRAGSTIGAVNFPHLNPPPPAENISRILNVHRNVPGVLSEINKIVSASGANITLQMLATNPLIGYLIMDVEGGGGSLISEQMSRLQTSIKTRLIKT